jgi:uncharacterized protein
VTISSAFIETYSGVRFRPFVPRAEDIRLQDIAHALSHQCRFSGHCREFYSVAEHSVRVSWLLARWGHSSPVQLWGLMHDASEAYLQDVAAPLKRTPLFDGYRDAERDVMRAICDVFELPKKQPEVVKQADLALLSTEARDLMPFRPEHWGSLTEAPLEERITPWTSREARRKFIHRFVELRFNILLGRRS